MTTPGCLGHHVSPHVTAQDMPDTPPDAGPFSHLEESHLRELAPHEPSRFFILPHTDVEGLMSGNPAFAQELILKLIGKVRALNAKVRDLALKDVYGRFVGFLETNAEDQNGERVVTEALTQSEIAARIGGSREMVSRIVRDLTAGAYIAVESKRIRILKKLPAHW